MSAPPDSPYKGLAAFADSELDALLFFGREQERETIVANLLASRLTILYGPSGVGKSSLLHAGIAQELRRRGGGAIVVHDSWIDDPVSALTESIAEAVPGLGPTAGLVDTAAAAAYASGELFLLLDQFEEHFLYHDAEDDLDRQLPELLRRPGLRVSVLIALRDDALAGLDAFAGRIPGLFANMLRLDRLDRDSARAAIVGPLQRYSEITGREHDAEPELVEAVLDEVAAGRVDFSGAAEAQHSREQIEAPFLQLVLEQLWHEEQAAGSTVLRLETFRRLGGAEPIVREHVQGALERLPAPVQPSAARVVRQLVTPSGTKIAHTAADLSEYAELDPGELQPLLETLVRERVLRGVDGAGGSAPRFEIFHDILAAPILDWRARYELERERRTAHHQRRRLQAIVAATLVALIAVTALAVFAFIQRSDARTQARRAHGRELAAQALAGIPTDPASSLALALQAATLAPGAQTEDVLRSSLLALREEHVITVGAAVVGASFAPHGGHLLVGSSDGRVGVYAANGRRLIALPDQSGLTRTAWSGDGRLFATGRQDGTVTVWRAADGRALRSIRTPAPITALAFAGNTLLAGSGAHLRLLHGTRGSLQTTDINGAAVAAAISPDARLIAYAARRGDTVTTRVIDTHTGRTRYVLPEHGVDALIFSADGRLLATGSTDTTARLWNAATGRLIHVLPMRGTVLSARFSADGRSLVSASTDGTAAIWSVATGERSLLLVGATGAANDAAFSPDGKEVAVAFADRTARLYSTVDGHLLAPLAGHSDAVTSIGFDPNGSLVVTASADGTARLWQAQPTGQLTTIDQQSSATHAFFAGSRVVDVSGRQARITSTTGRLLAIFQLRAPIEASAADENAIAIVDTRGDLHTETFGGTATITRAPGVDSLAYAPGGQLVAASIDGTIRIWPHPGATPTLVHVPGRPLEVAAASMEFAVRDTLGVVRIYTLDGHALATISAQAQHIALAPDGQTLATTHAREADLWDARTGKLLHRLTGHRSLVTDAEFSPDGTLLVTASDDHDGRVWDVATGRLLHILRGHFFPVRSAAFSPRGRWIVTASQFSGGLWDATTGQLVLYLTGHTKPLTGASFSSDGDWIVTGSDDETASILHCKVCLDLPGLKQVVAAELARLG